jgi:photosystem II stability/assembly factor-like uncharacterized protein
MVLSVLHSQPAQAAWTEADGAGHCTLNAVDFVDSRNGFAIGQECILSSSDGGASWKNVATGIEENFLAMHATHAHALYAARLGLYRSADGGHIWRESGDLSQYSDSIYALHFEDAEHLVLIKGGNILISGDGGQTYRLALYQGDIGYADKLAFPEPSIGYATGGSTYDGVSTGRVLKTTNGGKTWVDRTPPTIAEIVAADFSDANHGLLITFNNRVWSTRDGGRHWRILASDLPPADLIMDLRHRDADHWYAVTWYGRILESRDAGIRWSATYTDSRQRVLSRITLSAGPAVAVGDDGLIVREAEE